MILPAFGIISARHPDLSRKPHLRLLVDGLRHGGIAVLSIIVWAHHMFATGMPVTGQLFFMYSTMLIAIPTGVKIFNWVATMWRGSMTFEAPMLFAVGFIFVFTIGGFTGLILAIAPIDLLVTDTYYVVAHFHYVLVAGLAVRDVRGQLLLVAEMDRRHVRREIDGRIHFWVSVIFVQRCLLPAALPRARRHAAALPDYPVQFTDLNMVSSIGALGFGLAQVYFLVRVVSAGFAQTRRARTAATVGRSRGAGMGRCRRRRRSTPTSYRRGSMPRGRKSSRDEAGARRRVRPGSTRSRRSAPTRSGCCRAGRARP